MFSIDLKSRKSIYEQIIDGFKGMIMSGELKADEKMPSVRDLAESSSVNPNTIQKAYRELEQQGWIYAVSGRGNFVSDKKPSGNEKQIEKIYEGLGGMVNELLYLGENSDAIIERVKDMAKVRGNKD